MTMMMMMIMMIMSTIYQLLFEETHVGNVAISYIISFYILCYDYYFAFIISKMFFFRFWYVKQIKILKSDCIKNKIEKLIIFSVESMLEVS